MSPRFQQIFGTAILGAALATAMGIAVPQVLASNSVATPAPLPATAASEPAATEYAVTVAGGDGIDMNHWHETGHPKLPPQAASPYKPGKIKKDK